MKNKSHKTGRAAAVACSALLARILIQTPLKSFQKKLKSWLAGYANILTFLVLKFLIPLGIVIGESSLQARPLLTGQNITKPIYSASDYRNALFVEILPVVFDGQLGVLVSNNDHKFVFGFEKPLLGIASASENVSPISSQEASYWKCAYYEFEPLLCLLGFLAGWLAYDVCEDICHWWRTMRANSKLTDRRDRDGGAERKHGN